MKIHTKYFTDKLDFNKFHNLNKNLIIYSVDVTNDNFKQKKVDTLDVYHDINNRNKYVTTPEDIKNLYNLAKETNMLGISIGSKQFCIDYNDKCYYDAFQLYQITDKLNLVFKNNSLLLNQLRPFGFNLIEKNSFLKKQITEFAMGFN